DSAYWAALAPGAAEEAGRAAAGLSVPLGLAGRRALDLACGVGRYSRALAAGGAAVVGLDLSAPLLAAARRASASGVAVVRGGMRRLPFRRAAFGGVASMFPRVGYFEHVAEDRQVLAEVARVVGAGGVFVLDTLHAAFVRATLVPETERSVGRWTVLEQRSIDGERVVKRIRMRSGDEVREY